MNDNPVPFATPPFAMAVAADCIRFSGRSGVGAVCRLLLGSRLFRPVFTLRLAQATARLPAPLRPAHHLARLLHRWTQQGACMDLPWETRVGPGLLLLHGWGLVVNPMARIGANVTLFHGVTIGQKDDITPEGRVSRYPVLGDGVWVGPNAVIIGGTEVGDESIVAALAVVTRSVPARSLVAGNPGRVVGDVAVPDIPRPAPVGAVVGNGAPDLDGAASAVG